jgi:hypothetical protein
MVRDINGRLLLTKDLDDFSDIYSFNTSGYGKGFYLITITNEDFTMTKKLIIK